MTPFATGGRYVLQVVGLVGDELNPGPDDAGGRWLKAFDPEFAGGRGIVDLTTRLEEAARFPSMQAAMACYTYRSRTLPTRPDGQPNKPMTAYTVTVAAAPDPTAN
jgi:hypothetical protein